MHLSLLHPREALKPTPTTSLRELQTTFTAKEFKETHHRPVDGLLSGKAFLAHEKPSSSQQRV